MSFIFTGFGLAVCAAAAGIYYAQEREKTAENTSITLFKPKQAQKSEITPKKQTITVISSQVQEPLTQNANKLKIVSKKKISLYSLLLGSKKRRPSGEKIYQQRINKLAGYMQRNLERGVDFKTLQQQMKLVGWQDKEILKAYIKIKQ